MTPQKLIVLSTFSLFAFSSCKSSQHPTKPAGEESAENAVGEKPAKKEGTAKKPAVAAAPKARHKIPAEKKAPAPFPLSPGESHFTELTQISYAGENAEAYWSFSGKEITMQARYGDMGCDQIARFEIAKGLSSLTEISSGEGTTTCSYFLPGDQQMIYASTHLGGPACPPRADMSQGYVWALYDTFDIFKVNRDGSNPVRLTNTKGYDAEGTVCALDGSIIFTSLRDGDLDIYRMNADGTNVKRLTNTPGYDGGAFFNSDCTKIVWRASRPKPGPETEDYQRLLKQNLVRPSKLELFVANADGSDATQVTYLNAASFGPFFYPDSKRIIFSTNYGDPKGREFNLFAVNIDGTNLEQITNAPGFDGFPMFSPDGKTLIFASNRATKPGEHDTNLFLAKWTEGNVAPAGGAAERIRDDITWLADPAREGRGVGTKGLEASGAYLEKRFKDLGLVPAGEAGYRNKFTVPDHIDVLPATKLVIDGRAAQKEEFTPLGFSGQGSVDGQLVYAGYGIVDAEHKVDDYSGVDVKGKIAVVRRFVPDLPAFAETEAKRRHGDFRLKAWLAKERGAKALLVVDSPISTSTAAKMPDEAPLPKTVPDGAGDSGIPVLAVKRAVFGDALAAGKTVKASVTVALKTQQVPAFNVVGKIAAKKAIGGPVIIGAHYDHLGMGGQHSLAPDRQEAHVGADDNASGTAAVLEIARTLVAQKDALQRDVYLILFSGEESGVLGSSAFVKKPPRGVPVNKAVAMLNLDMVGRLRENKIVLIGGETAAEWAGIVEPVCATAGVLCVTTGGGFGPSDHTPFYGAGVPVLHFFTGSHGDYHKPSDRAEKINALGAAKISEITSGIALVLAKQAGSLTFKNVPSPAPRGDLRSYNASLGTVPDYAGLPNGQRGMLLAGVRPGGAAEVAGMKRGDVLIKLGAHEIGSVNDLMYVLNASKPGESVIASVLRDGKKLDLEVTFQESTRPK